MSDSQGGVSSSSCTSPLAPVSTNQINRKRLHYASAVYRFWEWLQGLQSVRCFKETLSPTSREEDRLRMFKNRMLREVLGHKLEDITGGCWKLHDGSLQICTPHQTLLEWSNEGGWGEWGGHVAHIGEKRDAYRVLVGKTEGKRRLLRPGRRWKNNIKMDVKWNRIGGRGLD